jgi:hypothetical protein
VFRLRLEVNYEKAAKLEHYCKLSRENGELINLRRGPLQEKAMLRSLDSALSILVRATRCYVDIQRLSRDGCFMAAFWSYTLRCQVACTWPTTFSITREYLS